MILIIVLIICLIFMVTSTRIEKMDNPSKQIVAIDYEDHRLIYDEIMDPDETQHPPIIQFKGHPERLYSLVLVDLDAPSATDPTAAEWRHWVVINVPGGEYVSADTGDQITPYAGPSPPAKSGTHRYIFKLYEQPDFLKPVDIPNPRSNWSSDLFAETLGLKNKGQMTFRVIA